MGQRDNAIREELFELFRKYSTKKETT